MSGRDEELLSAHIDGELSGDERASVEQWLADDAAARELMGELAEASGMVRALPRATAPADLRTDVLARLRAVPPSPGRPIAQPRWRRHAIWMAASAAGLLLAVVVYRSWQPADGVLVADNRLSRAVGEAAAIDGRASTAEVSDFYDFSRPTSMALPEAEAEADANAVTGLPASSSRFFAVTPQDAMAVAQTNAIQFQVSLETALEQGIVPMPGEGFEQLGQMGDQVVIVQYRVVDINDMFDNLQVILTRNSIVSVSPETSTDSFASGDVGNGQVEAIYLDTPVTNFNTAIHEITNLETVTAVTTNAFADDLSVRRLELLESVQREAERLSELKDEESVARRASTTRVSEAADKDGDSPAVPPAEQVRTDPQDGLVDRVKPLSQPADAPTLSYQEGSPVSPARATGGEAAEPAFVADSVDAYQVRVPVRQDLVDELQVNQNGLYDRLDREESRQAGDETAPPQSGKARWQSWNLSGRKVQGPLPPDRVRVVILFVPEKPE